MKAIITGGSKGIGLAIKQSLKKDNILVEDWSRTTGVNLLEPLSLQNYLKLKDVDILINNFGGGADLPDEDFITVLHRNYTLTAFLTQQFIKNKKAKIVITISSISGKERGNNPYYTAAKAAQIALMKSLSAKHKHIRFNTICPGPIYISGKKDKNKLYGKPDDVANLVSFLCSNKAKFITGACITIDGGTSHSF